jgi:hypothetical protein
MKISELKELSPDVQTAAVHSVYAFVRFQIRQPDGLRLHSKAGQSH